MSSFFFIFAKVLSINLFRNALDVIKKVLTINSVLKASRIST